MLTVYRMDGSHDAWHDFTTYTYPDDSYDKYWGKHAHYSEFNQTDHKMFDNIPKWDGWIASVSILMEDAGFRLDTHYCRPQIGAEAYEITAEGFESYIMGREKLPRWLKADKA